MPDGRPRQWAKGYQTLYLKIMAETRGNTHVKVEDKALPYRIFNTLVEIEAGNIYQESR